MKTLRISAALYLYEELLSKGCFTREESLSALDVSIATFKRVLSDLRCYLEERHPNQELVFDAKHKTYLLRQITL